jgi:nicotinate-nucleotide pyrophosphorylase (carboxylating)
MSSQNLKAEIAKVVENALIEDCAFDDATSDLTISKNTLIAFEIKARQEIIFCGKEIILKVFEVLKSSPKFKNSKLDLKILIKDGQASNSSKPIVQGFGDAKLIFAGERVLLNLIQHLSGISTLTQKFVATLNDKKIKILDTRKTLPNLRALEKYAVLKGGGKNHRFSLADMILIKDNHIAAAGGVLPAIELAKENQQNLKIEVECDNLAQVAEALKSKPNIILLDNMKISDIKKAIALINKKCQIEISGGINLQNIKKFSGLKVDFISVGLLTHSARAVDIGLDIV